MARIIADGEVRIEYETGENSITDITAPSIGSELDSAVDITGFLSSLDTPLDGEAVPSADLSTAFDKTVAGTYGGNMVGEFYRDDTTDTAWTTFPRNETGFIVIRRFGGSGTALAASDEVEVWPVRVIARSPAPLDRGGVQMFTVNFATREEPELAATVAA